MAGRMVGAAALDASALTLSGLCLIHCLGLPLLAATLPLAGVLAEVEWIHRAFVIAAVPITGLAIMNGAPSGRRASFILPALLGLAALIAAAFVHVLHDHEVTLTVVGAMLLAAAHLWRWRQHVRAGEVG